MSFFRSSFFFVVPLVVMFTLGGLWNSVLVAGWLAEHAPSIARAAAEVKMPVIALAYALTTAFMAFLFSQSFRGARPGAIDGFQFGGLFGVIMTLPAYLLIYAGWDVYLPVLLADAGWHIVEQGAGGVAMALIYRPAKSAAAGLSPSL